MEGPYSVQDRPRGSYGSQVSGRRQFITRSPLNSYTGVHFTSRPSSSGISLIVKTPNVLEGPMTWALGGRGSYPPLPLDSTVYLGKSVSSWEGQSLSGSKG